MVTLSAKENSALEKIVADYQSKNLSSGIILVAKENQPVYLQTMGFANYATQAPFSVDLPFPIASLTKQFSAVAALLLHEDKKLDLNMPIITYLHANHPIWDGNVPNWANIVTVHHLLTHTSGIKSYTDEKIHLDNVKDGEVVSTILSYVKNKPLHFTPGTQYEYNNTGFLLLSEIIKTLSPEKEMSAFLQNRIFTPLSMLNTYLPTLAEERRMIKNINNDPTKLIRYIGNLSLPKTNPVPMHQINLEVPLFGAGAMISSVNDLLKWQEALYQGKVISKDSLKLMLTPHITGKDYCLGETKYGYGIFIEDKHGEKLIYCHGGWIQGIRAELSYAPQTKTSVICLSNLSPDETQEDGAIKEQIQAYTYLAMQLQRA